MQEVEGFNLKSNNLLECFTTNRTLGSNEK